VTPESGRYPRILRLLQSRFMALLGIFFLLTALKWGTLLFVVQQNETVLVTRFGKVIRTMAQPGLHMKLPVIDVVRRFDNRILACDGQPTECPTKAKRYLIVDCFALCR